MTRPDANSLSLRIVRTVLDGAEAMTVDVGGTEVEVAVERLAQEDWPRAKLIGLDESEEGPWPRPLLLRCTWAGGTVELRMEASFWHRTGAKKHHVALSVKLASGQRQLVWITLPGLLADAADGDELRVGASVSMAKRSETAKRMAGWARALKDLVADSGMPMRSRSFVEVFRVQLPECEIRPSAKAAFRRLVRVALLKLDFYDSDRTASRGALVDVPALARAALASAQPDDEDTDSEDASDEDDPGERRYWAGGFSWSGTSHLDAFIRDNYWQIGWGKDAPQQAARMTWRRFDEISPGDWFAIKGYGGQHDLVIHYLGEVASCDAETGRLELIPLDRRKYRGKAPRGPGAGSWFDTLVPVRQPQAIAEVFGVEVDQVPAGQIPDYPALNLILHGPPGTGKTYQLQHRYQPLFTRVPTSEGQARETLDEFLAELTWFEATMLTLHALGGEASVSQLCEHRFLTLKYAAAGAKAPLRAFLWNQLQNHALASSTTVKLKRRAATQVFDKREDGVWLFPDGPPAEAIELAEQLAQIERAATSASRSRDYEFVTFHQSYAYEDFVEGIRPHLDPLDEDAGLRYVLEDGVFKRAVRAALRLAGFEDSIHAFCGLSPEARRAQLEDARHYALFVDEINRGNVANVFGELITLLEDDKRLGCDNEVIVTLPYSKTRFGVPSNLHLIGTMNTADRSVEALDTALRRRFEFIECMPRYDETLDFEITGGIDPGQMLRAINARVRKLRDRDHEIGHAYLMALASTPTLEALKRCFARKIIPLLQETFFGDWGQIELVLGSDFVRRVDRKIQFASANHDELEAFDERPVYEMARLDQLTNLSFRKIYEDVAEDD